jgi:hypothetical protein
MLQPVRAPEPRPRQLAMERQDRFGGQLQDILRTEQRDRPFAAAL